jgi:hypothetical protein
MILQRNFHADFQQNLTINNPGEGHGRGY